MSCALTPGYTVLDVQAGTLTIKAAVNHLAGRPMGIQLEAKSISFTTVLLTCLWITYPMGRGGGEGEVAHSILGSPTAPRKPTARKMRKPPIPNDFYKSRLQS